MKFDAVNLNPPARLASDRRGIATLMMILIVAAIGMVASDHGLVLHHVNQELALIDYGQKKVQHERWRRLSAKASGQAQLELKAVNGPSVSAAP